MSQKGEYLVQDFRTLDVGGITQYVQKLAENGWELLSVNPPLHYFRHSKSEPPKASPTHQVRKMR
jgi:hypothetical protein